jgi:hypothetical protein
MDSNKDVTTGSYSIMHNTQYRDNFIDHDTTIVGGLNAVVLSAIIVIVLYTFVRHKKSV